ncbi:MAG: ABC transporter permease [Dehalococcoidia bacterium]|nr:ABC transporter permease [Dehalococcoidia bacterium]
MTSAAPTFTGTAAEAWRERDVPARPESYLQAARRRFMQNRVGLAALGVLGMLVLSAILAPWLTTHDPTVGVPAERLLPIGSAGHVLGTDEQGRDMLTRLLYGGRLSLIAGLVPVLIATSIGTTLGAVAGYLGGWVAAVIMRTMDMFYAFPTVLLAIAVSASLGPGLKNVIIAMTIVYIAPIARVAEAATRKVVVAEFIEAARLTGASTVRILFTQVLANIFSPIFVYASGLVGLSIVIAASLSFLGLGVAPPAAEWGFMLNALRGTIYVNPWVAALPGLFIFAVSISFNMLADAIRDALDVKG